MNSTPDPAHAPADDVPPLGAAPIDESAAPATATEAIADASTDAAVDAAVEAPSADSADAPAEGGADVTSEAVTEPAGAPDAALLEAHDLALAALREITPPSTIGDAAGYRLESDGVVSLRFENALSGYPGWFWTVSLARVADAEPTVLEVELLPGDGALLAPDWVPWAVRLAEYQAAQVALAEAPHAEEEADDDDVDELDDVDDLDATDFDDDGSPILHAGDVDGVDIDELDEDAPDEDDDDSDEDDDDSDDEDAPDADDDESDEDEESDEDVLAEVRPDGSDRAEDDDDSDEDDDAEE